MKNYKKGFIIPLLVTLIAILALGGGVYVYSKNNSSIIPNTRENTETQATSSAVSVSEENNSHPVQVPETVTNDNSTAEPTQKSVVPVFEDNTLNALRQVKTSYIELSGSYKTNPINIKIDGKDYFTTFNDNSDVTFSWDAKWADKCELVPFYQHIVVGKSGSKGYKLTYHGDDNPQNINIGCSVKNPNTNETIAQTFLNVALMINKPKSSTFSFIYPTEGTIISRAKPSNVYVNDPTQIIVKWTPKISNIKWSIYNASTNSLVNEIPMTGGFLEGGASFYSIPANFKDGSYYIKITQLNYQPANIQSPVFKIVTDNLEMSDLNKNLIERLSNFLASNHLSSYKVCDVSPTQLSALNYRLGDGNTPLKPNVMAQYQLGNMIREYKNEKDMDNFNFQCSDNDNSFALSLNLENDKRFHNATWCVDSTGFFSRGTIDKSQSLCVQQ